MTYIKSNLNPTRAYKQDRQSTIGIDYWRVGDSMWRPLGGASWRWERCSEPDIGKPWMHLMKRGIEIAQRLCEWVSPWRPKSKGIRRDSFMLCFLDRIVFIRVRSNHPRQESVLGQIVKGQCRGNRLPTNSRVTSRQKLKCHEQSEWGQDVLEDWLVCIRCNWDSGTHYIVYSCN